MWFFLYLKESILCLPNMILLAEIYDGAEKANLLNRNQLQEGVIKATWGGGESLARQTWWRKHSHCQGDRSHRLTWLASFLQTLHLLSHYNRLLYRQGQEYLPLQNAVSDVTDYLTMCWAPAEAMWQLGSFSRDRGLFFIPRLFLLLHDLKPELPLRCKGPRC